MGILKFFFILLEVLLVFNLLILVHELGHFLAARWRGLAVEKFAIWFGKPIWKKTIGGVEYRLGWIPAGGFVAIPQMAPMEAVEGKSDQKAKDLPYARPLDKIIVALAGPAFSLGLAFAFALVVWFVGRPVSEAETTTMIGYVLKDGPAAKAGLLPGDKILQIDSTPVTRFSGMGDVSNSIVWNIANSEAPLIAIKYERNGTIQSTWVEPTVPPRQGWGRKNLRQIGIAPAQTPMIARIFPDSPAAEAGLRPHDLVMKVDDTPLLSLPALADYLNSYKGGPILLTIKRGKQILDITVTPRVPEGDTEPRIGIQWDDRGQTTLTHPNPIHQVVGTIETMWATLTAVANPQSQISLQHLSGPVGIMRFYYIIFEAPDGWRSALWFSVFLNVNLAILNLLPLPVLDGGHILLALIEMITRRRLNIRILEVLQTAFALVLVGFMLYVTFYDVLDLPWKQSTPKAPPRELRFSQPAEVQK